MATTPTSIMLGVTLFDAVLRFDFGKLDPQLKGLRMALNVSNIFSSSAAGCYYSDGRNVYLTMKSSSQSDHMTQH